MPYDNKEFEDPHKEEKKGLPILWISGILAGFAILVFLITLFFPEALLQDSKETPVTQNIQKKLKSKKGGALGKGPPISPTTPSKPRVKESDLLRSKRTANSSQDSRDLEGTPGDSPKQAEPQPIPTTGRLDSPSKESRPTSETTSPKNQVSGSTPKTKLMTSTSGVDLPENVQKVPDSDLVKEASSKSQPSSPNTKITTSKILKDRPASKANSVVQLDKGTPPNQTTSALSIDQLGNAISSRKPPTASEPNTRSPSPSRANLQPSSGPQLVKPVRQDDGIERPESQSPYRIYRGVPFIRSIIKKEPTSLDMLNDPKSIGAFLAFVIFIIGLHLWRTWRRNKVPRDIPATYDHNGPRFFNLSSFGGKPDSLLDSPTLDYLADTTGYFKSQETSCNLDVGSTVKGTVKNGGMPTFVYHKRKKIRTIVVLEDLLAEPLVWNSVPNELVSGLRQRGAPVIHGKFRGLPDRFTEADGKIFHLEDFEDNRSGYLVLIFSDGKALDHKNTKTLEALARWPMVAWMEPREPRFWDDATAHPGYLGIPVYPASTDGLNRVMLDFLKEEGSQQEIWGEPKSWRGIPPFVGKNHRAYIECFLRDALLWAQSCSMLQPVSLGLASCLRKRFYPNLPAERIGRLFALPGTIHSVSGLRFSKDVLISLRTGFPIRHSEEQQKAVLRFLLNKLEKAKPTQSKTLAYLTWEWIFERV